MRQSGEEQTEAYICLWLAFIQDMAGVKNKMNVHQIQLCAQMVLEQFKALKIADINLISNMAIRGEFGQFYENISIPKVIEWFSTYFDQRCEVGAMESNKYNETGQTEARAKDTVKALIEIGVIDQEMIDSIGKNSKDKEEEFQKVKNDYYVEQLKKRQENE